MGRGRLLVMLMLRRGGGGGVYFGVKAQERGGLFGALMRGDGVSTGFCSCELL